MTRLCEAHLDRLSPEVARPDYDRRAIRTGVVHLGVGAFHRAHQAAVFDALIGAGDHRWGIVGASLRSPAVADQINPQDGLYTVAMREGDERRFRLIGALKSVLVAPNDPAKLVAAMAAPDVHLVTLTVTEKGYLPDAADSLTAPVTAPAYIAAALAERRARGLAPFTAISCDNLPRNGHRLREAVLALAHRHDGGLADWIERLGAFPETMVDRIVPATTPENIAAAESAIGLRDEAMVKTEPFLQWVIEDQFAGERPDWAVEGVRLTRDVAPWESAKLRLLNGAHSAMAYLGGLSGVEFVHEFVARPEGRGFVEALWDEAETTLDPPPELDLAAYRRALMARFANTALQHRTRQIAMDGSQKLPQRLLAGIAVRLERGQPIRRLALGVAAWMRWQDGVDEAGRAFAVDDPLAGEAARRLVGLHDPADKVRALAGMGAVFPPKLAAEETFIGAVTAAYRTLVEHGAWAAIAALPGKLENRRS